MDNDNTPIYPPGIEALVIETSFQNTNPFIVLVLNHWLSVDNFNYATWCLHDSQKKEMRNVYRIFDMTRNLLDIE